MGTPKTELEDVLCIFLQVVGLDTLRPRTRAEPAQIGRHDTEPALGQLGDLVVSLPTVPGQAVQLQQQGAIFRAVGQGLERHASRFDLDFLQ